MLLKGCNLLRRAKGIFAVPKTLALVAVPLFELYDNAERYGPVLAGIPQLISRYDVMPNLPVDKIISEVKEIKLDSAQEDAARAFNGPGWMARAMGWTHQLSRSLSVVGELSMAP